VNDEEYYERLLVAVIEDEARYTDIPFPFVDVLAAAKRSGLWADTQRVRQAVRHFETNGWARPVPYLRVTNDEIEVQLTPEGRSEEQPIRARYTMGVSFRPN